MTPYSVTEWGSHPDDDNDDCWCGEFFATLEEAERAFADPPRDQSTVFVVLDGPDVNRDRRIPGRKPARDDRGDWEREHALQAGMGLGCDGYNDANGW